jgi:hypothetical protein
MGDFEFLFALFGLLFGLIIAELALKFADAIERRRERPMGVLTPALAFLLLTDLTTFWLFIWGFRNVLTVSYRIVFAGVLLAMLYFLAAALLFPRADRRWTSLDEHYWSRKRLVAGAILLVNVVVTGAMLSRATPEWDDWWFYVYFPGYLVALTGLALSRSRRLDFIFLGWAIANNLIGGSDLFHSEFARQVGIISGAAS